MRTMEDIAHLTNLLKTVLIMSFYLLFFMEKTFCDVRVFHSGAVSNQCQTVEASCKKHEDEKKRTYNARVIEVEKATFTPLVFSTTGGIGEANHFLKRVATHILQEG